MTATSQAAGASGSAERWGPLWGARPGDWALSEDQQRPTYEEALRRVDLKPGQLVLDIGCGVGGTARTLAVLHGARVTGVDLTPEFVAAAADLSRRAGVEGVSFVQGSATALPFEDASFDVVISNGVFNLSPRKDRVFAEAARVLRPGGRLAISDVVSGRPLKERTRRDVDLWAACIAGAVPRRDYLEAIAAQGLEVREVRGNDYRFISERALEACSTYAVECISLVAVKP